MTLKRSTLLSILPTSLSPDRVGQIRTMVKRSGKKIVVLDDDPTGTQTVYDTKVLTEWSIPSLIEIFMDPRELFFILTNSRSLAEEDAAAITAEIVTALNQASEETGVEFVIISRSDSTLRGYFEAETTAVLRSLREPIDGIILVPFFEEGGRYTIDDIHYVADGDVLIPAAETEFAKDKSFGYHSSNLREWVQEKTAGRIPAGDVVSISIHDLRDPDSSGVRNRLRSLRGGQICLVNAVCYADLESFIIAAMQVEEDGKIFLYRTAASFVRARAGITRHPLWKPERLTAAASPAGGLIVAGSYVQKSSRQIESLILLGGLIPLEVSVEHLLKPGAREKEITRTAAAAERIIRQGEDALVFTSRRLFTADTPSAALEISRSISSALVQIVLQIKTSPAWMLAKGGITSSDIATHALEIRSATVMGQIQPGVPVWKASAASRWPDLTYVIFPGNVGDENALCEVVKTLRGIRD